MIEIGLVGDIRSGGEASRERRAASTPHEIDQHGPIGETYFIGYNRVTVGFSSSVAKD